MQTAILLHVRHKGIHLIFTDVEYLFCSHQVDSYIPILRQEDAKISDAQRRHIDAEGELVCPIEGLVGYVGQSRVTQQQFIHLLYRQAGVFPIVNSPVFIVVGIVHRADADILSQVQVFDQFAQGGGGVFGVHRRKIIVSTRILQSNGGGIVDTLNAVDFTDLVIGSLRTVVVSVEVYVLQIFPHLAGINGGFVDDIVTDFQSLKIGVSPPHRLLFPRLFIPNVRGPLSRGGGCAGCRSGRRHIGGLIYSRCRGDGYAWVHLSNRFVSVPAAVILRGGCDGGGGISLDGRFFLDPRLGEYHTHRQCHSGHGGGHTGQPYPEGNGAIGGTRHQVVVDVAE